MFCKTVVNLNFANEAEESNASSLATNGEPRHSVKTRLAAGSAFV